MDLDGCFMKSSISNGVMLVPMSWLKNDEEIIVYLTPYTTGTMVKVRIKGPNPCIKINKTRGKETNIYMIKCANANDARLYCFELFTRLIRVLPNIILEECY
jgi:hypothetical protein